MIKRRKWPNPADSALDRARAIVRSYRQALHEADPERCAVLDRAAVELGETWVAPQVKVTDDGLLTTRQLADALGEKYGTVWQWWNRGWIPREDSGLFNPDAVREALVNRSGRRKAS